MVPFRFDFWRKRTGNVPLWVGFGPFARKAPAFVVGFFDRIWVQFDIFWVRLGDQAHLESSKFYFRVEDYTMKYGISTYLQL